MALPVRECLGLCSEGEVVIPGCWWYEVRFGFCDISFPLSLFGGFDEEVVGGGGSAAWLILITHLMLSQ